MRAKALFAGSAILLAAAMVAIAAGQSATPNSSPSSSSSQAQQPAYVLQVKARAVTVDVVATDSHGNPVRDLKPEEFQISDNGPQKIAHFAFIDKSAASGAANTAEARPKGFYTNQAKLGSLAVPPTVVLLDALNSDVGNLADVRRHMLHLLKTLPANTPVAVFVLRQSLEVVQDFTSDPALLSAALDKAMKSATPIDPLPGNDPSAPSLVAFDENGEDYVTQSLESFENRNYADVMDFRVRATLDALRTIAHYLSGYPGRKNLIWVSASFPIALPPASGLGSSSSETTASSSAMAGDESMSDNTGNSAAPPVTNSFSGTRSYAQEIQDPSNGLTDAHVAVYPVDARALETDQVYDAAQDTVLRGEGAGSRSMGAQVKSEGDARAQSQETMDKLAEGTGGKTCKNTNDLSECIETALKDSSSYYELAYYPQNAKWDGSFHTISVKTTRPGLNLRYRRGYFALNEGVLASHEPPEKRLQQACQDYLPSTAIPITAQSIPSEKPDEIRYLMSVPAGALSVAPDGQSHKLNAEMATCVYSANGGAFRFTTKDLSRTLSDTDFSTLQTSGLRGYLDAPKSGTERVRIALLDLDTGVTGALDIAVHPGDFVESAAAPAASPATSPAASANTAPVPQNPPSQPAPAYTITFHSSSGATSALDWSGDTLSFHGDSAAAQQFAPAFFHHVIDPKFRCQDGQLVPRDAGDATPNLHFSFKNPSGQTAVVDLTGSAPQYSGDLPMDPSAKPFFEALWNLCHCGAAPHLMSVPLQRAGGGSILRADALRPF